MPPVRFVERPRVREALASAVPIGLAVVVAPGGFGKTVALADFAAHAPFPIAWLTIGPAEGDLVAFVEALTEAIRRIVPRFGRQAVKIARQTGSGTSLALAEELAGELADHAAPIGVVLDDYHAADSAGEVGDLLTGLIERRPSNCFFAIASRTLPALPYARLLALGRMAGIPAEELRFTRDETALFLGRPADDANVERVQDATGGWAAALTLGEGTAGFPGALEEYLEHEVFEQQPPAMRDFLLRASVPERLTDDICRRVLEAPDGATHLSRAHRAGLFVMALPDGGWRLHDLFRDFLRAHLRQSDPGLWQRLNRAVAEDLVAARRPAEAVTQLVSAELSEAAADLLLEHADVLAAEGRWGAIRGWMAHLPARVFQARPRLLTLHGRALMPSAPTNALELLDRAIEGCLARGDRLGAGSALAYRAARLMISGRYVEVDQDCERVGKLLEGQEHPALAIVARVQGLIAVRAGNFDRAFARLREAIARAQRSRDRGLVAMSERALGFAFSNSGDLPHAAAHYERAAQIWQEIGDLSALAEVRLNLGHVYEQEGSTELAHRAFVEVLALSERLDDPRIRGFALDNVAILTRQAGETERPIALLEEAIELARRSDDSHLLCLCLDQLARTYRVADRIADAEILARQSMAEAERAQLSAPGTRARATLAGIVLARGGTTEALILARGAARALQGGGEPAEVVRALVVAAAAAHALADEAWLDDIAQAAAALGGARNRAFLRSEIGWLVDDLHRMADDPRARSAVRAVLAAVAAVPAPVPAGPQVHAQVALSRVAARLLGRPELQIDGAPPVDPARFWTRRPVRLLLYLLEQARTGLPSGTIVERLWPDAEPGQGQSLIWDTVHRLRTVLSGADRRRGREIIIREGDVYRLSAEFPLETDVSRFAVTASRGLAAPSGSVEQLEALHEADKLYRGPYLEGLHEPWVLMRRRELARLHGRVLRRLVECAVEAGPVAEAVELAARLTRLIPRSESACYLYARALERAGETERADQIRRVFTHRTQTSGELRTAAAG